MLVGNRNFNYADNLATNCRSDEEALCFVGTSHINRDVV